METRLTCGVSNGYSSTVWRLPEWWFILCVAGGAQCCWVCVYCQWSHIYLSIFLCIVKWGPVLIKSSVSIALGWGEHYNTQPEKTLHWPWQEPEGDLFGSVSVENGIKMPHTHTHWLIYKPVCLPFSGAVLKQEVGPLNIAWLSFYVTVSKEHPGRDLFICRCFCFGPKQQCKAFTRKREKQNKKEFGVCALYQRDVVLSHLIAVLTQ